MNKKRKNKWKGIFLWSLASLFLVGALGLFTFNYAINKVFDSLSRSLEKEVALETKSSSIHTSATNRATIPDLDKEIIKNDWANMIDEETGEVKTYDVEKEVGNYAPEVSTDKAVAIKEEVTLTEKASVTSILMGNLSLSDIKLFQEMASGGMTVDEKRAARKVLLEKLSPEEYNTLVAIAKKYGVSRGKTYDEAAKEEAEVAK